MKILDANNNEVVLQDLDLTKGSLTEEQMISKHHEAIEPVQPVFHHTVKAFYFEDGTKLEIQSEDDPHIKIINAENGQFDYINLPGENKTLKGLDIIPVIDSPGQDGVPAWDEYETILRWTPYTEEECVLNEEIEKVKEDQQELLNTGLSQLKQLNENWHNLNSMLDYTKQDLEDSTITVEELTLMMAELVNQ